MSKPVEAVKGPRTFGPKELFDYVRMHLGLLNRRKALLYPYKLGRDALVFSRVEMDDVISLQGGEAA